MTSPEKTEPYRDDIENESSHDENYSGLYIKSVDKSASIFTFASRLTNQTPKDAQKYLTWLEGLLEDLTGWSECQVYPPPLRPQGTLNEWKDERDWWTKIYDLTNPFNGMAPLAKDRIAWLHNRDLWVRDRKGDYPPDDQVIDLAFGWSPKRTRNSTLLVARKCQSSNGNVSKSGDDERLEITSLLELAGLLIAGSSSTPQSRTIFGAYFRNREDRYRQFDHSVSELKCDQSSEGSVPILRATLDRLLMSEIQTGKEDADVFKDLVADVFDVLFDGELVRVGTEIDLHGGLKRIDIVYRNVSEKGLFYDLPLRNHLSCPYILVECKNYGEDIKNPEIDQLLGRFGGGRGSFGFLVCNKIDDHLDVLNRCREATRDHRGWVVVLDVDDLAALLRAKILSVTQQQPSLLRELLDEHLRLLMF